MEKLLADLNLCTVCRSARCPNRNECFASGTATFLILGDVCTRNCRFCAIPAGAPKPPDPGEPDRLAEAARSLGLKHVVVTSVTRDDLPDGGADHFHRTILALKNTLPESSIEVLIPDFSGNQKSLFHVLEAGPDVLNHNIETPPRLYDKLRPGASYERSLGVLERVKSRFPGMITKSGLMLGLGETHSEILEVMEDLCRLDCDILTLGQYLKPDRDHHPIVEFIPPERFEIYRRIGRETGFHYVSSGPFVRSSYRAREALEKTLQLRPGVGEAGKSSERNPI